MDRYIGLDAHASSCTVATVGPSGRRLHSQIVETNAGALIRVLRGIPWKDYEENLERLRQNARDTPENRRCPPREGPTLLQGMVLCGVCGRRMTVRYQGGEERPQPWYICQGARATQACPTCQSLPGAGSLYAFLCKWPRHQTGIRPSKTMDRWFRAEVQSGMGRVHRSLAFMMARYNTFLTESGVGKAPRCLVTFLSWALIDSTALVV